MAPRQRWEWVLLAAMLIAIFWLRMALATSVGPLSYDSYLTVREVEHVLDTGLPLRDDPLSVTGSTRVGSAVFTYLLAAFVLIGDVMYKAVPNLAMALLLIPVYLLAFSITRSRPASFLAVLLAATGPAVFGSYIVTPSSVPLATGLLLLLLLLLQDIDRHLGLILTIALLLTFLSPLVFVLVLALLMILLLLRAESFGIDRKANELFFFTLMLAIWFHVLVYKQPLFTEGFSVLWQNLPAKYAALQFGPVTFIDLVYGLGTVTFLFGVFGAYHALFEMRAKIAYSVIGALLATSLLIVLRLVELQIGLFLLSLLLAIMAGHGLLVAARYVRKTKTPWIIYPAATIVALLFVFSAVMPALAQAHASLADVPTASDITGYEALSAIVPSNSIILTTPREGAAVQYFSGRTTLTDDDFFLLTRGDEIVADVDLVYTTSFSVSVVGKADKLGFTHVLFSSDTARQHRKVSLPSADSACLQATQLSESVTVYRVACRGVR